MVGLQIRNCFRAFFMAGSDCVIRKQFRAMKKMIKRRWTVEGFYCFCQKTSSWEFEAEYRVGEVVWEFGDYTLTCHVDGTVDHTVPYTIFRGNTLIIDFSSMIPHFNRYIERYKIVIRDGEVWLYDLKTKIRGGFWLAVKLLPAE